MTFMDECILESSAIRHHCTLPVNFSH